MCGWGGGQRRSQRCPQGSESVTGRKNGPLRKNRKCSPQRETAGLRKGVLCLRNLRCRLQSPNYLGITEEAKDILMG